MAAATTSDEATRRKLFRLMALLAEALTDHQDNTGASCNHWLHGHDCCGICNNAEAIADTVSRMKDGWGEPILR